MSGAFNYRGASGGDPPKWVINSFYKAGRVVWSPSDFQYFMAKVDHTSATDPVSDMTNWQPTGDRAIKSIQRGTGAATATSVTISAVNVAKAETRCEGYGKNGTGIVDVVIYGHLSNSTTLTVSGGAGFTGGGGFSWQVIERY